jgi:ribonuclease R
VHITELGGEYFKFDEMRQELRGERTGMRYAIGTRVRVQVSRVDLDGRKIDFRLVREGEDLTSRAMKDKGVSSSGAPVKASAKRGSRHKSEAVAERGHDRVIAAASAGSNVAMAAAAPQSAMQAFKSAVKNAANKMKGRKPRR